MLFYEREAPMARLRPLELESTTEQKNVSLTEQKKGFLSMNSHRIDAPRAVWNTAAYLTHSSWLGGRRKYAVAAFLDVSLHQLGG